MAISSNQRVLEVILRMLKGETVTFDTWQHHYEDGKSKRTFQRDMRDITAALTETNFKYDLVRKQIRPQLLTETTQYSLVSEMTANRLTDAIAIGQIVIASRALSRTELTKLLTTLVQGLLPIDRDQFKQAIQMAQQSYLPLANHPVILERMAQILTAIAEHQRLTFDYQTGEIGDPVKQHVAQPETLFFDNAYFYVAMCREHQTKYLLYRLDRIVDITAVHAGDCHRKMNHYSLQDYRKQTYLLALGDLTTFRFKCRINPQTALDRFPESKMIRQTGDNEVLIEARAYEDGAMLWLLGQGANIEVVSPTSFVPKFRANLVATLEQY